MYSFVRANKVKTWIIISIFVVIVGALGTAMSYGFTGGPTFTIPAFIFAGGYAGFQYFAASKIALGISGAKEVTDSRHKLYRTVENLAITQGMPMPKVYITPDPGLNAFATGRDPKHAHVAATQGLMDALTDSELEGVMAHELGHVKNYDIRVSMIVMGLAMAIAFIADMGMRMMWFGGGRSDDNRGGNGVFVIIAIAAAVLAPLIGRLVQSAVSRQREYLADATGVQATRYPEGLANALAKLDGGNSALQKQPSSAQAHLYISNPLRGSKLMQMFSTHPPIPDRIARIHQMSDQL